MFYEAFTQTLRFTAQAKALTLALDTCIIPPPTEPDSRLRSVFLDSTLHSVIYAVSEPFYTSLWIRIPADGEPAALLILTSTYHMLSLLAYCYNVDAFNDILLYFPRTRWLVLPEPHPEDQTPIEKQGPADITGFSKAQNLDWKLFYPYVFALIQTAAMSNAALLVVVQRLVVTARKASSFVGHVCALTGGLFYFFFSRLLAHYTARSMGLPFCFGQTGSVSLIVRQMGNLLLLVSLRGGMRLLFDLDAYPNVWKIDGAGFGKFSGTTGFFWLAWQHSELGCVGRICVGSCVADVRPTIYN